MQPRQQCALDLILTGLAAGVPAPRAAWRQEIVPQPRRKPRSDHPHTRAIIRFECPLCDQRTRSMVSSEYAGVRHSRGLPNEPWVPTRCVGRDSGGWGLTWGCLALVFGRNQAV